MIDSLKDSLHTLQNKAVETIARVQYEEADHNTLLTDFAWLRVTYLTTLDMGVFDSRIVRRTVCQSMPSRVQKLLQWVVALKNQHAIRAVCKGTPTKTY